MANMHWGIDHVQGDPFAAPSSLHIEVSGKVAAFPEYLYDEKWKQIALEDYLIRQFGTAIGKYSFQAKRIRKEWNYFCD